MLHIGQRIKEIFEQQPKNHNIKWFSEQLGNERNNIYNIFNRPSIDTELLVRISRVLNHNFFQDMAEDFEMEQMEKEMESQSAARRKIYVSLMKSIGKVLNREIRQVDIEGKKKGRGRVVINRFDGDDSPFPVSKFKVYIYQAENEKMMPHLHLYSEERGYEIRVSFDGIYLSTKTKGDITDPKDFPISEIGTWLGMPSGINPELTNRQQALSVYMILNPSAPKIL